MYSSLPFMLLYLLFSSSFNIYVSLRLPSDLVIAQLVALACCFPWSVKSILVKLDCLRPTVWSSIHNSSIPRNCFRLPDPSSTRCVSKQALNFSILFSWLKILEYHRSINSLPFRLLKYLYGVYSISSSPDDWKFPDVVCNDISAAYFSSYIDWNDFRTLF